MDIIEKTENTNRHPWELSRCDCILRVICEHLDQDRYNFIFADVGAGDKYFAQKLTFIKNTTVIAIDKQYKELIIDEKGILCLCDISMIKKESVDILIMMDVIEHVEDESLFLLEVFSKVKLYGLIIMTVPAWQFLYSSHDVFLNHYRRYNRYQLRSLLKKRGVVIEQCYYFYFTLFLVRVITKFLEKITLKNSISNKGVGNWKYGESNIITRIIYYILYFDFFINTLFNKLYIRIPGLSLLAVCRKEKN